MLQRTPFSDLDELNGIWSREELEDMDCRFTTAISRALSSGHESPVAAAATIQVGVARNGGGAAIERAFESAWDLMVARRGNVSAAEITAFMQTLCPGISSAHVRLGFAQKFRERGVTW